MDARMKDKDGKTICPACGKHYIPVLGERDGTRMIQEQFPNATPSEREQLVTGICSDRCWRKYIGEEE
jgi:uncharacterized Zn finger protein (UPF0148 family)